MKRSFALFALLTIACGENVAPAGVATAANDSITATSPAPITPPPAAPPAAATPTAPTVNGPKLMPVDEASQDPALVTYRNQLLEAVRRRDANAVAALVDPNIKMSFGGDAGVEALKKTLAREGGFEDLEFVLTHGGAFIEGSEKRAFWAPYVYSNWPDDRDSFSDLAITEENVPLRESKDANSPVIATLSYDLVTQVMHEGNLRQVKTADGKTGWVEANKTRSPIAYRAGFNKSAGEWKMNALVAGD